MTTTTAAAAAANMKGNDTHLQHLRRKLGGVQTTTTPAPPLLKTSTHARFRGLWLSSSTPMLMLVVFQRHHLPHPPPPKTSIHMLVFGRCGPSTLPFHHHRKRACRCSFSVIVDPVPHLTTTHHFTTLHHRYFPSHTIVTVVVY